MLPFFDEYLLSLKNNNYSKETLDNYERDLEIFSAFLFAKKANFEQLDKLMISEYKGFLRNDNYIPVLREYQQSQLAKDKTDVDPEDEPAVESEGVTESMLESAKDKAAEKKVKTTAGRDLARSPRQQALYRGQLSSRSVNRMLSALRSYLTFLVDIDKPVPISPSAIKLIKAEKKEKQVADLPDLIQLIEYPPQIEGDKVVGLRNRAIMELLFATGMRISELINLNREHIRIKEGKIMDDRVYVMGKGKKQRFVYLTPRAIQFLEEYLATREDEYPALFIPSKGTRRATANPYIVRLSQNYVQMKIAEYRRRLGIIVPTSAHSLRHGFATYLAEDGASPAAIQRLLGHESLQTTTRYVHASDKFAESAHRQYHPLQK